jgi:hypothetical protein
MTTKTKEETYKKRKGMTSFANEVKLKDFMTKKKEWKKRFEKKFIGKAEKEGNVIRFYGGIDPVIAFEIEDFISNLLHSQSKNPDERVYQNCLITREKLLKELNMRIERMKKECISCKNNPDLFPDQCYSEYNEALSEVQKLLGKK